MNIKISRKTPKIQRAEYEAFVEMYNSGESEVVIMASLNIDQGLYSRYLAKGLKEKTLIFRDDTATTIWAKSLPDAVLKLLGINTVVDDKAVVRVEGDTSGVILSHVAIDKIVFDKDGNRVSALEASLPAADTTGGYDNE